MSSADPHPEAGRPWYNYFWPWFIVILLATTVIAGVSTVVIAVVNRDSLVRDDWYESGTAINRRLGREVYAAQLGLQASVRIGSSDGRVEAELEGAGVDGVDAIDLVLSHATQSDRDIELRLRRASGRHFEGQIEVGSIPPPSGRWYLKLEPGYASDGIGDRAIWRLSGSVWLPLEEPIRLGGDT